MIREALSYLVGLGESLDRKPFNVDGLMYWPNGKPLQPPGISPLAEVKSLFGFMSYLDSPEYSKLEEGGFIPQIVVRHERLVSLVLPPDNLWYNRQCLIDAEWRHERFPFGKYLDLEEFVILAQCQFVECEEKTRLISHLANIVTEESVETEDDGITQTVIKKDALNRKDRAQTDPVFHLAPFRTFPEINQPESAFLLRMQKQGDSPRAALFEADGGLWVSQAIDNIATFLRSQPIVKEKGVKVIG